LKPEHPAPAERVETRYAADLVWLDCLLEREALRLRARYELSQDELRGLYVSDQQVDELLRRRAAPIDPAAHLGARAAALRPARRGDTPLARLAVRFGLSEFENDLLLLALAPELSLKYETLYAYLNNDIARRHASVDLGLRVLDAGEGPSPRAALSTGGRLFVLGLLDWIEPGEPRAALARGFTLAPSALHYLLGLPLEDARLPDGVRVTAPLAVELELLSASTRDAVDAFAATHPSAQGLVVCTGETPIEQFAAARTLAARQGQGVVSLPLAALARDATGWPALRTQVELLTLLADAVLVVYDELGAFPRDPAPLAQLTQQMRELASSGLTVFWAVPADAPWAAGIVDLPFQELRLPETSAEDRAATWAAALRALGVAADSGLVEDLAERFSLPSSRIAAAAESAARLHAAGTAALRENLWQAARTHSTQALGQLAGRVRKPHRFEQLVLPDSTLRQVREITSAIAHRGRVYGRWRMAERTGRGNGLMILFAGASGTGKTMTASCIANELGLDLYRIDLASVVSKYIGETEKNLDRIFTAARHSNGILFFDEADALMGKRSEVKDAHDRYANIEIAYLLQKMEEHEGVVILATNLAKNLDQAFSRRMHYVVDFPRPDAALRERLWRGMFPGAAPVGEDVDFGFLAQQFDNSGGEIQMIALDAAFLASAGGQVIGMAEIVQAMARHQQKQGSPAAVSGFRQYHGLLQGR
jgi:hypothetical protein